MDLHLTFAYVAEDAFDDINAPQHLTGLPAEATTALTAEAQSMDAGASVTIEAGSLGKGAAGPGIQFVLHTAETMLNDGASVFAWGTVLWSIVHRVQGWRSRRLDVQDPCTIGLLAAAADERFQERVVGASMGETICLTGGGPTLGTDSRDVWLTPFILPSGDVWALFSATDGGILGEVVVPARWTSERGEVTGQALAQLFQTLNTTPAGRS